MILTGKLNNPLTEYTSFAVSSDMTAIAFGTKEGVYLYRSKNLLTDNCKDSFISHDKFPVRFVGFNCDNGIVNLYCATSNNIFSYQNCTTKKELYMPKTGYSLYDVNSRGDLVCVSSENNSITVMNNLQKLGTWNFEDDKKVF